MSQTKTVINAIIEFVLGKKYYANIIYTRGTRRCEISSIIFLTRKEADKHRMELLGTLSYLWIETISFRSRKDYNSIVKRYNTSANQTD